MKKVSAVSNLRLKPYFPLEKYGYRLIGVLNNENRWHAKIVCNILDEDSAQYVSTAYAKRSDYLRLLETTTYLTSNNKLSPKIAKIYPNDLTVVCRYVGDFFSHYLLNNPSFISPCIASVRDYLRDINSINLKYKKFIIPSIIKEAFCLEEAGACDFVFLPKTKTALPHLAKSNIEFNYGYGIEDPHIWNFRILQNKDRVKALTTDFDYFTENVNYFWEMGYFYATLRWFKKSHFSLGHEAEKSVLSLFQEEGLKSEFMFWLGALSGYCGYKDSLRNFMMADEIVQPELEEQYKMLRFLDEKVSYLARELCRAENDKKTTSA